jgi:hypothetical protein
MFSGKGLRKRVAEAVGRTLEPGEMVRSTVYLHVYGDASATILTGLPVGIRTWIAVLTDRRVILLKGNELNAANSEMVAAYPTADVTVVAGEGEPASGPKHLDLQIRDHGTLRFAVPLVWRKDAAGFVAGLSGERA